MKRRQETEEVLRPRRARQPRCHPATSAANYPSCFVYNFLSHTDILEVFNTLLLIYNTEKLVRSYFCYFALNMNLAILLREDICPVPAALIPRDL